PKGFALGLGPGFATVIGFALGLGLSVLAAGRSGGGGLASGRGCRHRKPSKERREGGSEMVAQAVIDLCLSRLLLPQLVHRGVRQVSCLPSSSPSLASMRS